MSGQKRSVRGADRLVRRLEWLRGGAEDRVPGALGETAEEVSEAAQAELRLMPGDLPHLAGTVDMEGEGRERAVVVRHPAAPFIELGTRHMPPRPFLQRAADRARTSLRKRIGEALVRLLRRRP
ncbi:MAG: hypothetical protein ACLFWF_14065 [Alphaproteobacteria bacterium]